MKAATYHFKKIGQDVGQKTEDVALLQVLAEFFLLVRL